MKTNQNSSPRMKRWSVVRSLRRKQESSAAPSGPAEPVFVSNAVQLADELAGVKAVVAKDNKLFVSVDKTISPAEMALVFKGKEYPFEKIEQNPVRRVD